MQLPTCRPPRKKVAGSLGQQDDKVSLVAGGLASAAGACFAAMAL